MAPRAPPRVIHHVPFVCHAGHAYGIRIDHTFALRAVAGDGVAGNLKRAWVLLEYKTYLQKHVTDSQRPLFFVPMPDRVSSAREGSVFFPTKFRRMSVPRVSVPEQAREKLRKAARVTADSRRSDTFDPGRHVEGGGLALEQPPSSVAAVAD